MEDDEDYTAAYKLYNGGPISPHSYPFKCWYCNEPALVVQKGTYVCAKCYIKKNFPND